MGCKYVQLFWSIMYSYLAKHGVHVTCNIAIQALGYNPRNTEMPKEEGNRRVLINNTCYIHKRKGKRMN